MVDLTKHVIQEMVHNRRGRKVGDLGQIPKKGFKITPFTLAINAINVSF